jgi:hypothetical protein
VGQHTYVGADRAGSIGRASVWITFAGLMLIMASIINTIDGIGASSTSIVYVAGARYILGDLNTWGWLGLGVLQMLVAWGVFAGNQAARWAGVVIASLNAIAQLTFIVIAIDVLVIYGSPRTAAGPHSPDRRPEPTAARAAHAADGRGARAAGSREGPEVDPDSVRCARSNLALADPRRRGPGGPAMDATRPSSPTCHRPARRCRGPGAEHAAASALRPASVPRDAVPRRAADLRTNATPAARPDLEAGGLHLGRGMSPSARPRWRPSTLPGSRPGSLSK